MRLAITALLIAGLVLAEAAETVTCSVCGEKIEKLFYRATDRLTETKVVICQGCEQLDERCFACGLPVKKDFKKLSDSRYLCARDARDAVLEDNDAKRICEDVKDELNQQFSRFMTFPTANVAVSIVDRFNLQNLFKSPGYEQACISVFGATISQRLPDDKLAHSVSVLSALTKSRIRAVTTHEYTHAWLAENVSLERRRALSSEAIEGFCELIAYKFMEARQEAGELRVIKSNPYTRGQIDAFLEAEKSFGFNSILDWMKAGEDVKLETNDPGRVRAVANVREPKKPATTLASIPVAAAPPAPEKLMLKGISGSANRRFALINDKTFVAMEVGKVHVGRTNLLIRCLEVRAASAVIQIDGTKEKQELFLGKE